MALTKSQMLKFWKEWGLAKAVLVTSAGYTPAEAEDWRRETTATALGKHKKPAEMGNRDMDLMLGAFRGVHSPEDFDGQMQLEQAERTRLLRGIQTDAPNAAWLESICRDIYGTPRHEGLPTPDLLKLRRRCAGAARKARMDAAIAPIAARK
jgi:hypothetical protein